MIVASALVLMSAELPKDKTNAPKSAGLSSAPRMMPALK